MIKPKIFLLIFLIVVLNGFSQNQANNWFFGANAGLSFASSTPTNLTGGALTNSLGCSAISGTAGNLLFYTDGVTVYNSSHTVMPNGNGLHGVDASQPAIIVKQPQSSHVYYIFTVGGFASNYGLEYSVVDMSLASGAGSVTIKNVVIDNNCRDKLTAGKHCNGDDLWIVSTTFSTTNAFYTSALLTPTGLATPISSAIAHGTSSIINGQGVGSINPIKGQMKMSPNSKKIAIRASYSSIFGSSSNNISTCFQSMIADFNSSTGQLSIVPGNTINSYYGTYISSIHNHSIFVHGCEFSPNSMFMYDYAQIIGSGTTLPNFELQHSNLCDGSMVGVYNQESSNVVDQGGKRQMQLGTNGKIYVATQGSTSIGVINNPNNVNGLATYTSMGASLGTATCQWGLPNFPGYYFEQKPFPIFSFTSGGSCLTTTFSTPPICSNTGYSVTGYQWNFGDPPSGTNNVSFLASPSHTFSNTGSYTVSLIRYFLCNTNDTIHQVVTIASPSISVNTATLGCSTANASVLVTGGVGPYTYLWSANSQTNAVANFSNSGIYSVTVSDQGSGGCMRQTNFNVLIPTFSINIVSTPSLLCHSANNSSVSAIVLGGSGTYSYTWSQNSINSPSLTGLSAGTYSLNVIDNVHNCITSQTFTLSQANAFGLQVAVNNHMACEGNTVIINAYPSGGAGFYTYTWSPVNSGTNQLNINPPAGNYIYTINVQDAMGCGRSNTVSFNISPNPTLSIPSVSACPQLSATMLASGANSYTWWPGNFISNSLTVLANANFVYTVSGSNSFNCTDTKTINLFVYPAATVNASNNSPVCVGQNALFTGLNGVNYFWKGPNNFTSNVASPQIINVQPQSNGLYTLTISDMNGCKDSTQINLLIQPNPALWINSSQTLVCIGQMITLTGIGANNYVWFNNSTNNPITFAVNTNTVLQVTGTSTLTSCSSSASLSVMVKECNTIGLLENERGNKIFHVYPNPNQGHFDLVSSEEAHYKIMNSLGQLIDEGEVKIGNNKFSLTNYAKGLYYLQYQTKGNKLETIKLFFE